MAKVTIVNSADLGGCWSNNKFHASCGGCNHYETCTRTDRKYNKKYDLLLEAQRKARKVWMDLNKQVREYKFLRQ